MITKENGTIYTNKLTMEFLFFKEQIWLDEIKKIKEECK